MKHINIYTLFLLMAAATLTACKKEEVKQQRMVVAKPEPPKPMGTQQLDSQDRTEVHAWRGNEYTVSIKRSADESMPVVDDGTGVKYYDNRITVSVKRADGSSFYSRTFTKNDFSSFLSSAAMKSRVLYAITLHEVSNEALQFVACVGSPDASSDDYQLLEIRLSADGSERIKETAILDREVVDDEV